MTESNIKQMSPSNKAKEIIEKFMPLVTTWDCYYDVQLTRDQILPDAKKCAMICIDEIINGNFGDGYDHQFWMCVKEEVEKL